MGVEELKREAEALSEVDRVALIEGLLRGLPQPAYDVSDEEIEARRREIESGEESDISFEELKQGLRLPI